MKLVAFHAKDYNGLTDSFNKWKHPRKFDVKHIDIEINYEKQDFYLFIFYK